MISLCPVALMVKMMSDQDDQEDKEVGLEADDGDGEDDV